MYGRIPIIKNLDGERRITLLIESLPKKKNSYMAKKHR